MDFSSALRLIKTGSYLARSGWNGRGMYIYLDTMGGSAPYEPCIVMFTAENKYQPGWLASQADMLAEDWEEVGHA